jgi:hypothetical protein
MYMVIVKIYQVNPRSLIRPFLACRSLRFTCSGERCIAEIGRPFVGKGFFAALRMTEKATALYVILNGVCGVKNPFPPMPRHGSYAAVS